MNQCIREMLRLPKNSRDKDIFIYLGDATISSNVKGEKFGGSPTGFFSKKKLKKYTDRINKVGKKKVKIMKISEHNTTKKHYKCQKDLSNIINY